MVGALEAEAVGVEAVGVELLVVLVTPVGTIGRSLSSGDPPGGGLRGGGDGPPGEVPSSCLGTPIALRGLGGSIPVMIELVDPITCWMGTFLVPIPSPSAVPTCGCC